MSNRTHISFAEWHMELMLTWIKNFVQAAKNGEYSRQEYKEAILPYVISFRGAYLLQKKVGFCDGWLESLKLYRSNLTNE